MVDTGSEYNWVPRSILEELGVESVRTDRFETADGRDIYFHRNSVLDNAFDRLTVGSEVRFVEEIGEKGPQASTVREVSKHHLFRPRPIL